MQNENSHSDFIRNQNFLFESMKSSDQKVENDSDQNLLDGVLELLDLRLQLRALLGHDGAGDNRARDTASATEGRAVAHENALPSGEGGSELCGLSARFV